jgi:hypothetical protein
MEIKDVKKVIINEQKVVFIDKEGREKTFKKHPVLLALVEAMIKEKVISLEDVEVI